MPPEIVDKQFAHIKKYLLEGEGRVAARILPGEYYVTDKDEMITTVLGSCISACICDPDMGVGGMNHFMLPEPESVGSRWQHTEVSAEHRYGNYAMESLINDILGLGGRKTRLLVKVFGGGKILSSMTDVGRYNIDFVKSYLSVENLEIAALDVGDRFPRRVNFYPRTGKVRVKKLSALHSPDIALKEQALIEDIKSHPIGNDGTLFH